MNLKKRGIRWSQPYRSQTLSTDTPCPESWTACYHCECHSKTTNSNSLLPSTASNDIQQHVNSTIVVMLIFTIWMSLWFGQLCSRGHGTRCQGVQFNAKWTKIPMAITTVWYTKGIYVSVVNCFVVILPHHN